MAKTCLYEQCSNPVWGGGYCKFHQRHRGIKPKKQAGTRSRGLYERPKGRGAGVPKTGDNNTRQQDKAFYERIWETRNRVCFSCSTQLSGEPLTIYFHHILPKRNYPQLRHTDWNIVLLCGDCHSQVETMIDKTPKVKELTFQTLKRYESEQLSNNKDESNSGDVGGCKDIET